jgi:hypothetical protein
LTEQGDEQRELVARCDGRRQHDQDGDERPAGHLGPETDLRERSEHERQEGEPVAEPVRRGHRRGFEQAR